MRMQLVREKGIHVASPIEKIGMFLSFPIFIPVVASLSLSLSPDIASSTFFSFFVFIFYFYFLFYFIFLYLFILNLTRYYYFDFFNSHLYIMDTIFILPTAGYLYSRF